MLSRVENCEGQYGIDEDLIETAVIGISSSGISQVVTAMENRMIVSQVLFSVCTRTLCFLYFCIMSWTNSLSVDLCQRSPSVTIVVM